MCAIEMRTTKDQYKSARQRKNDLTKSLVEIKGCEHFLNVRNQV